MHMPEAHVVSLAQSPPPRVPRADCFPGMGAWQRRQMFSMLDKFELDLAL